MRKMNSKVFVFVGLLFAVVLLVSSEVAADTFAGNDVDDTKELSESKFFRCRYGCCRIGGRTGCVKCCKGPKRPPISGDGAEEENDVDDSKVLNGCDHGCCASFRDRCTKCCPGPKVSSASGDVAAEETNQVAGEGGDAKNEAKPQN